MLLVMQEDDYGKTTIIQFNPSLSILCSLQKTPVLLHILSAIISKKFTRYILTLKMQHLF